MDQSKGTKISEDGYMTEPRRGKYNARRTKDSHSAAEKQRGFELQLMERNGDISNLRSQVEFELQPGFVGPDGRKIQDIGYIADFTYVENGRRIVEEVKGYWTEVAKIKRKMFLFNFMLGKYAGTIDEYRIVKV